LGNLIKEAFDIHGKAVVIGDSSEPRTLEEIFRMGINIKPAIKGPDSINAGIDIMKQHKIFITKQSKNMLDEFYSYLWAKDKNGDLTNQPDSRSSDHAIDAARYICSFMLSQKKKNYGTYTLSLR
jgi:phage terminase large subunit